jgi:Cu/Ag efflux protein CusF
MAEQYSTPADWRNNMKLHSNTNSWFALTSPGLVRNKLDWMLCTFHRFALAVLFSGLLSISVSAHAFSASVVYQPMVSGGLAAGQPFEAWIVLDKPLEPNAHGYSLPAGATIRFTFARAFTPRSGVRPEAVLLYGWPQRAIPVKFVTALDPQDPRTVVITLLEPLDAAPPDKPGLKAIHLRTGELNPSQGGNYPIDIQFISTGELTGTATAVARITDRPVPVVAAYNQLHDSRNENWQHVSPGETAAIPIDLLVTLPGNARSSVTLLPATDGSLVVISDEEPIGTIKARGAPVTLKPMSFGPGFSRLGIVRFQATAGMMPGTVEIDAQLTGGPTYTLHLIVDTMPRVSKSGRGSGEGEILSIDKEAGEMTVKHGPIAELDMSAMTMMFRVNNPTILDRLKVGDRIRFVTEKINGAYVLLSTDRASNRLGSSIAP